MHSQLLSGQTSVALCRLSLNYELLHPVPAHQFYWYTDTLLTSEKDKPLSFRVVILEPICQRVMSKKHNELIWIGIEHVETIIWLTRLTVY